MLNIQREDGLEFEFEGKTYKQEFRTVLIIKDKTSVHNASFTDLKNGDIFIAKESNGEVVKDTKDNHLFIAESDPYIDELGILSINFKPYVGKDINF